MDAIRLIVGLGNPGDEYAGTRHNVGFWFVDALARAQSTRLQREPKFFGELGRLTLAGRDLRLLKPQTYMNHSGRSVAAVARYFEIAPQEILVAHDELDLPAGQLRLKRAGGHAGHNGLRDSIAALGSAEFWRLRIGIGHPGSRALVTGYVLGHPSREDAEHLVEGLDSGLRVLDDLLAGRFQHAMNRLHRKPEPPPA